MMEIILLEKVHNLGDLGDRVKVRSGYGRNYLIPDGKAVAATDANIKMFKARQAELEKQQKQILEQALARAEKMDELNVQIVSRVGAEGKLFGSVSAADIAAAVTATGVELSRRELRLPQGPLRTTGEYHIDAQLHVDVKATIKVDIVEEEKY